MTDPENTKSRLAEKVREIPPSGIRKFFDLVVGTPGVISLGVGEPDFVTPWRIRESAIFSLEKGRTSYTSNAGLLELREAISQYLSREWGADYDPATEIMITVGVSEALDLALRALLDPGDEVILVEPGYVSYAPLVSLAGGVPVGVKADPTRGFKPTPEALRAAVTPRTKLVFLNYPNNPTGAVLDQPTAASICELVRECDLLLLTDEIYAELTYDQEHYSLAGFPGMKDRTVLVHGFSKAFAMTGWRLGYLAAPADIVGGALKIHQYCALCAPIMAQMAALEALAEGVGDMQAMKEQYDQRRRVVTDRLNELGLSVALPEGAFYVFPSIRSTGLSSTDFATRLLQETRVAVVPGSAFGPFGEGYIRCSYASSIKNLQEALSRMEAFLDSGKGR
jgi:aminotransferase